MRIYLVITAFTFFCTGCTQETESKNNDVDNKKNVVIENTTPSEKHEIKQDETVEFDYNQYLLERNISVEDLVLVKENGYKLFGGVNPFYLAGDFDGDNIEDIAIMVSKDVKVGIFIISGIDKKYKILGAGNEFYTGGDDFSWMNIWFRCVPNTLEGIVDDTKINDFKADCIWVEKVEAASAIIYWDGNNYLWHQIGD